MISDVHVALSRDEDETPTTTAGKRLPSHTLSDILIPMSFAIDLAEGRDMGHGQRVAFVAMALADVLGLNESARLATCYAGLFHDVGVIPAGSGMSGLTRTDEQVIFSAMPLLAPEEAAVDSGSLAPDLVADRIVDHSLHGGRIAKDFALSEEAARGISFHHERWDGMGYPHGLTGDEIPIISRILTVADHIESIISQAHSPLIARRNLPGWLNSAAATIADPRVVVAARSLTAEDSFWLGFFSASLPLDLREECGRLKENKAQRLMNFAERFANLADSRFSFTVGISSRVAKLTEVLGRNVGMSELRLKQLRIAALLHDVGQLGIPERIMAKPGILSVDELEVLHEHPAHGQSILAGINGLEEVAEWVGAHHERPDGRGYPEGREEIPLESRILAIADAYVSITSDRPHRLKVDHFESMRRLRGAAGSQLDRDLLGLFFERVVA